MDSSNVLKTVKVVKSKSTKKKSSVNKSFKCIVIDDSDDDELFFGLNKRPNSANIEKQSDLIVPVVVNEKKARSKERVKIETAKVHKKNEGIRNNDIHHNKNEAVEDIDFLIEKPDESCIIPPDNTLLNLSLPENDNEVIEIIDCEGTSMEELAKVFNEQVKMKFNSHIIDVKDEKKTFKGNNNFNNDSNEEKSELLPVSAKNEFIEKVVINKIDQIQAPFTSNNLSETSTFAIPENSITQPINSEKILALPPNTSQDKPANIEENKVDLEESKVNVAMTFGNFSSKDKTDQNNLDNDVIMTVFPTRERSKIWESMKTKKLVVPTKKVIHPVLVKETKVVELEHEETVSVQETVVTPLMEFQNQLQHQIKDLVSTLQELHTVEKNAILKSISQQQESTHKQALESIVDMLIEKKAKLEATVSPKLQSQVELSAKMGEKPLPTTIDEQQNRIFSGSRNFAENIMRRDSPLNNQSDLSSKSSVSNNHSVLGHCESNKVIKKIRNPQNAVSILQTPVHRKKPPVPFSEMSKKSSVSCNENNATKNVVPMAGRGFALFHEILKDCSSIDVSVQSNLLSSNDSTSKTPNLPSSVRSISCETSSTLKEVVSDPPNSSNTSKTNENHFSVNDFSTDISNASKPSNSSHSIDLASDVISQKEQNNAKPNALYSKVNTDYKNSIDEKLSKMRNELINPENKWIYESKENVATDGCLQNAQKVLKEVQNAKTLIDKNENFKYAEMLKYFEANPYLVEPDLLDVKKNIDENIKQMTTEIQTKIYCSDDQVDENPVVQKKVNSKHLPLRNLNKKVSKTRWK